LNKAKKIILSKGLRAITIPCLGSNAVTVLVLAGVGSKYESKKISGISHFLEHMYFKGTKKRRTHKDVSETLDKIGGVFNAFTGDEYTGYYAKVAVNHFDIAMDWVSDIFLNSTLPANEVIKEKNVIIEEINMIKDHPMSYVQELWMKLLYGDQPAGWSIAGTKESVSAINRDDLINYMKKGYLSENVLICVAGAIDNKTAEEKIKRYFGMIKNGKKPNKQKIIENQKKSEILIEKKETDQTHLCLGVRAYNLFHKDKYVLDVIETILGKMMSSRLFIKIREELGLAYYIRTEVEATTDSGFLVTSAGVDSKKVEKAINAILKEYKRISEYKVSLSELKKAKENIKGRTALSLESSDSQALFYGAQELLENKITEPSEIFKEIDSVTPDDILRVSKDIFKNKKINLAILGPISNREKLEKILKL
jgi:predicted Zn-dependent peptidase